MSKPRDPLVKEKQDYCELCETVTEWRLHKVGLDRKGGQRHRWRCSACHARRNRKNP